MTTIARILGRTEHFHFYWTCFGEPGQILPSLFWCCIVIACCALHYSHVRQSVALSGVAEQMSSSLQGKGQLKKAGSNDKNPENTQRVHVGIWYILRAQGGSHIPTLRPKYIPYSYMDPVGQSFKHREKDNNLMRSNKPAASVPDHQLPSGSKQTSCRGLPAAFCKTCPKLYAGPLSTAEIGASREPLLRKTCTPHSNLAFYPAPVASLRMRQQREHGHAVLY